VTIGWSNERDRRGVRKKEGGEGMKGIKER
jgi:hypothetical protein